MANTYLTMTQPSGGSRRKWTWSAWIKRSIIGTHQALCVAYQDSANATVIKFEDNDQLNFYEFQGSSTVGQKYLSMKARDVNAWYHLMCIWDSENSTADDRMIIYVNGVRQTAFQGSSNPSINTSTAMNRNNYPVRIGAYNSNDYFNGSMSHVNFCGGTVLAPTVFGETDATTGEWKIKADATFTPGIGGYSILKDGNTITDQSSNSNNFSLGGGTLTKTEDCPSNVFACGNVLGSGSVSFSNGNNTVHEGGTSFKTAIATLGASSGKYYAEVKAPSIGSVTYGLYTGFVNLDKTNLPNLTSNVGDTADSAGISSGGGYIYYNGQQFTGATTATTANDVVNLAMDLDNGFLYWGINGTYLNSGNPASGASGTGGMPIANITAGGTYTFAVSVRSSATINFNFGNGYFGSTQISSAGTNASGNGIFEYDVPTNFTALSTKGLNL